MKRILLFILLNLILISFVSADYVEDYKSEFSIKNESCKVIDSFVYDISDPWLFNSKHKYTTFPVIYGCCEGEECVSVIFDGNHKAFISNYYMREIVDLNYIRYNIHNGNLSEKYFEVAGLDFCDYFGFNDAKKETLNLASEVVESGALLVGTQKSYQVAKSIKTARQIGVIGRFNPTSLIAGVGCGYDNKKLNLALENIVLLNAYLNNINWGYSQEGYIQELTNSASLSKIYLKEYVESPTAMARGAFNWILNAFKFIFGVAQNPTKHQEIEKTEYQVAQDTLKQISNYDFYFNNPNKEQIILESNNRVSLKVIEFNETYVSFLMKYSSIKIKKPSSLKVSFTNIFYEPNYNLTEGLDCWKVLKEHKKDSEEYYKIYKFNSAINSLTGLDPFINCSEQLFIRENSIERHFDRNWLYFLIFLLIVIAVIKRDFIINKIRHLS
ncbi:MAG: hypothetical protein WC494_03740 [Candidatus Pacearchaeota archaeon]